MKSNVTYIDDLIDLDTVPSSEPNFNKKMEQENLDREKMAGPLKSKIRKNVDFRYAMNGGNNEQNDNNYALGPRAHGNLINPSEYQQHQQQFMPFLQENYPAVLNCVDVSNHHMSCPVCSRLYNNDKTTYIIVIILLVIVSIILLKRVLDKDS
jgi:hypothetical protein